uniref:Uncharacterized protein n=1 Tax=Strombidium inclinatum TaxID=197538 RepID=A0A7S3IXX2_9SPIT
MPASKTSLQGLVAEVADELNQVLLQGLHRLLLWITMVTEPEHEVTDVLLESEPVLPSWLPTLPADLVDALLLVQGLLVFVGFIVEFVVTRRLRPRVLPLFLHLPLLDGIRSEVRLVLLVDLIYFGTVIEILALFFVDTTGETGPILREFLLFILYLPFFFILLTLLL